VFSGRRLLIATIHGKEKVLSPLLEAQLGVKCFLPCAEFNSDEFGTFTGEVERKNDPLTALRKKCLWAMVLCESDLGVATEGSFGPHPSIPFSPANDELIIFIDLKNNLEITARELSLNTNYNKEQINASKDLRDFAIKTGFPEHRLILSSCDEANRVFIKDISSPLQLFRAYKKIAGNPGIVRAETDMRAMNNPTRMEVIEKAAAKLIENIKSKCPSCGRPGYAATQFNTGLPCRLCSAPTRSVKSIEYGCSGCGHSESMEYPDSRTEEDPMYCDRCNP
jgi:hypothetical protein